MLLDQGRNPYHQRDHNKQQQGNSYLQSTLKPWYYVPSTDNERNQAETTCRGNGASLFCTLQRRNLQNDQESQHTMWKADTTKPHVMSMAICCDICTSNQRVTIQLHMALANDQQLTYKTAYKCNSNLTISLHWKRTANVLTCRLE